MVRMTGLEPVRPWATTSSSTSAYCRLERLLDYYNEPLRICQLEFSTPHQKKQKDRKKELTSGGTDGNIIFALQRALKMREWWNWQTRQIQVLVCITHVRVQVPPRAPSRSKLWIACSDLFYMSERAHAAAPPFQTEPAYAGLRFGAALCAAFFLSVLTVCSKFESHVLAN